ncbi:MAG: PorV/PorQ family protein [Elusimicrobia bacterium]|nr:PorV/PorQ family protein [Elusimicrobiota bacterium]
MKKTILIFSGLLMISVVAKAVQTGAQFLKIGTDARLSGMGSAGVASAFGINALNYNPAGLSAITSPEATFSHSKWLMDANHDFIGFGVPVKNMALGIGVTRLSNGSIDGRREDRSTNGGYSAYDQAVSLGLGFKCVGGVVKYIQSEIAGIKAEAFAVDLGAKRKLNRIPVTLGFGVQNMGGGIKYLSQRDNLPLSVNAGFVLIAMSGVALAFDVKRLVYDGQTVFSTGIEYTMQMGNKLGFALRGGYCLTGITQSSDKSGLSVGAGLMALGAQLDYAVSPETGLGTIRRITLKKKF